MGELYYVFIFLPSNSKVHWTIDIIVVDIPEAYGVILSRYFSTKVSNYFAKDWSHLWFSYKGQPNKIKFELESYIKHMVTSLNDPNEMVMFWNSILSRFCFDTLFGELEVELSPFTSDMQYKHLYTIQIIEINCTIVHSSNCTLVDSSSTNVRT